MVFGVETGMEAWGRGRIKIGFTRVVLSVGSERDEER